MTDQPSTDASRFIRVSTSLLWAALGLGLVLQFMYADWELGTVVNSLLRGFIWAFALHGYLIFGIASGRNSARWISLSLFVGSLFLLPPSVEGFSDAPWVVATEIIQMGMQCLAYIGLFMRSSNAWFKARSTGSVVKG